MSGQLEVLVLHEHDARRAEEGGADRLALVGSTDAGGLSPEPDLVEKVRQATDLHLRVMLRLRSGFSTDGGEYARLRGLASSYLDAGADGIVMGFLNGHAELDLEVMNGLAEGGFAWTLDRAFDDALDNDKAWRDVEQLRGIDQLLTAGSARDVEHGLDDLLARARTSPAHARLIMAGGGLLPEHVPWLARVGVRAYHIAEQARPGGSQKAWIDTGLVGSWRELLDDECRHAPKV